MKLLNKLFHLKASVRRKISILAAQRLRSFNSDQTNCILGNARPLLPFAYLHCRTLAHYEFWEDLFDFALAALVLLFLPACTLFFSHKLLWLHGIQPAAANTSLLFLAAGILSLLILLPVVLTLAMIEWILGDDLPAFILVPGIFIIPFSLITTFIYSYSPDTLWFNSPLFSALLVTSMYCCFSGYVVIFFGMEISSLTSSLFGLILQKSAPEAYIFDHYADLIHSSCPNHRNSFFPYKSVARSLDSIVSSLKTHLPNKNLTGDLGLDQQILSEFQNMGNAIRHLKLKVCLNRSTAPTSLEAHIKASLPHVIRCDWDLLPRADNIPATRAENWAYFVHIVKMIFIAILPLFVLVALQQRPFNYSGKIPEMAITLIVLWTSISLFCAMDPNLMQKDGMVKTFFQLFSSLRKEK